MIRGISFIALIGLFSTTSHALDLKNWNGGRQVISPATPREFDEICVLPKPFAPATYKKKDAKREQDLCAMSFYGEMGVCPKMISTNPGVELFSLKAPLDKATFEAKGCPTLTAIGVKYPGAKTEAKLKSSTTCSYAPSLLAYYHVSRALGDTGNVPVAVVRTMNVPEHLKVAQKGALYAKAGTQIKGFWQRLVGYDGGNLSAHPELYDADQKMIYGALQDNPGGEEKYKELNSTPSYDVRYTAFMGKQAVIDTMKDVPVSQLVGSLSKDDGLQKIVEYKDISDLIVMDTLLSQHDRIGNIHFKCHYYILDANGAMVDKQDADCDKPVAPTGVAHATFIREMLLKDNDCGVTKDNDLDKLHALEKLRHMNADVYKRFMEMTAYMSTDEGKAWLKSEALFTDDDVKKILGNAAKMRATLQAGCAAGHLRLDLDVDQYLAGTLVADTRALCGAGQ